jgi:hypothetical protein
MAPAQTIQASCHTIEMKKVSVLQRVIDKAGIARGRPSATKICIRSFFVRRTINKQRTRPPVVSDVRHADIENEPLI